MTENQTENKVNVSAVTERGAFVISDVNAIEGIIKNLWSGNQKEKGFQSDIKKEPEKESFEEDYRITEAEIEALLNGE